MVNHLTRQVIVIGLLGILLGTLVLTAWVVILDPPDDTSQPDAAFEYTPSLEKDTAFSKSGTFVGGSRSGTVQAKPK